MPQVTVASPVSLARRGLGLAPTTQREAACSGLHEGAVETVTVSPVGFVQNDDLVSPFGQRHLLLSKHLDLVPHHIDAPATKASLTDSGTKDTESDVTCHWRR